MTTPLISNQLRKTVNTHSEPLVAYKNKRLAEFLQTVLHDLKVRSNDLKDTVIALYLMNNDLTGQVRDSLDSIRKAENEQAMYELADDLYAQQDVNFQIANILMSLNKTTPFASLYRSNQYYHQVERFLQDEMLLPKDFHFLFTYHTQSNEEIVVLINVDVETKVAELFQSVFFGYLMPAPKDDKEKSMFIQHVHDHSRVDLLTTLQVEDFSKNVKSLVKFSASNVIKDYKGEAEKKLKSE